MTYKDIAVKNEQRLKQQNERLKTILFNAISILEDKYDFTIEDVVEELGLRENEYDNIMYGDF